MLAKGSLPSGQWSGTSPFSGFAVCQKNSNVRCSMSSSDGAAAPVIAAAAAAGGTAPVVAGAGSPVDAAGAGAWTATVFATGAEAGASLADALTDAAVAGAAVVVLAAGGAVGAAEVAYRECSTGTIPASSSTHSSAMPARRSVREPADHPGFFDECGAPRFMAHDQRRGTRTGSARQCLRASSGGPGIRPPFRRSQLRRGHISPRVFGARHPVFSRAHAAHACKICAGMYALPMSAGCEFCGAAVAEVRIAPWVRISGPSTP